MDWGLIWETPLTGLVDLQDMVVEGSDKLRMMCGFLPEQLRQMDKTEKEQDSAYESRLLLQAYYAISSRVESQ